jgi:hypothetical protein
LQRLRRLPQARPLHRKFQPFSGKADDPAALFLSRCVWTSLHPLELSAQILKDLAISIRLLASSKRTYVGFGIEIVGTEPIEG